MGVEVLHAESGQAGTGNFVASGPTIVPVTVQGAAAQSANLTEWKDSAGIVQASVSPAGDGYFGTLTIGSSPTTGPKVTGINQGWRFAPQSNANIFVGLNAPTGFFPVVDLLINAVSKGQLYADGATSEVRLFTTTTDVIRATAASLAFYGAVPVPRRAGAAQVAVAVTGSTNVAPFGYTTAAQADAIVTLVNEIRATLVALNLFKGAA